MPDRDSRRQGLLEPILTGLFPTGSRERRTVTETYTTADVQRLAVDVGDGTLNLDRHDGSSLEVEATKYATGDTELSDVTVFHEESNGRLRLGAKLPGGFRFGGGGIERLTARVPAAIDIERVEVADGTGRVGPVSGDLGVSVSDGEMEVKSVGGEATVDAADGSCEFGSVGRISGTVSDGEVVVDQPTEVGDLEASDGRLRLAVGSLDGSASITASDGSVQLQFSPDLDATVRVRTSDGSVSLSEELFDSISRDGNAVRGQLGNGDRTLDVETSDGPVQVEPFSTVERPKR